MSDEFLRKWKIPTLFHAYWLKVTANETIDNPERSLRNYWIFHERDEVWHQFKRDHEQKAKRAAKTYSLSEWVLCAERCANFRNGKCTCGENVPPACRAYPIPPEECRNFTKTEGGEQ